MLQLGPWRYEWPEPSAMVTSGSELQLRVMYGTVALPQPASMLSEFTVTIEGHVDAPDLRHLRTTLTWGLC